MPGDFSVNIEGIDELRANIDKLTRAVDDAARIAVTNGANLIERRAKQKAPVLTGTLRRSIHVDSITHLGAGRWQSLTGPSAIYARIREKGGVIKAKPNNRLGGYLLFQGSTGWAKVKSVKQTGTHYMQRAFDESVPALHEIYTAAFREALDL